MTAILILAYVAAAAVVSLRWLRVAQREHYQVGRVLRFALRWWTASPASTALAIGALAAGIAAPLLPALPGAAVAMVGLGLAALGPLGLGIRGRTSPLRWTRRLRVVAGLAAVLTVALAGLAAATGAATLLPLALVLHPFVVEAALAIDAPIERRLGQRYVRSAQEQMRRVRPSVIGITGSYGKTTVKNYAAHLLGFSRKTVASRASYNNRMGLSLSINEDLGMGTEVFIAEMGTYGEGEIAELCAWLTPTVGVITAIGPVHLERMGSIDNIVRFKSEILAGVETAILNVDVPQLRTLADRIAEQGQRVVRCGSHSDEADIVVRQGNGGLHVRIGDVEHALDDVPEGMVAVNLALALGICHVAGTVPPDLQAAVASLPAVPNRLTFSRADGAPTILDDTYNANPAGAARALQALIDAADREDGRMVVVTPGMVELGARQREDNAAFARQIAQAGGTLVVVGRTNAPALVEGYRSVDGEAPVEVATRDEAIAWIRANAGAGDVVLYENDLPDHFP